MKLQHVILKAIDTKLSWIEAADIAGMSVRNMQCKREAYQNVRHFREKLQEVEGIRVSYSWVKQALQEAGLVPRRRKRRAHRKRRARRARVSALFALTSNAHPVALRLGSGEITCDGEAFTQQISPICLSSS